MRRREIERLAVALRQETLGVPSVERPGWVELSRTQAERHTHRIGHCGSKGLRLADFGGSHGCARVAIQPDRCAERSGFSFMLVSNDQTEACIHRLIAYGGFEIHVELTPAAEDTFNVTFQIKGGTNLEVLGVRGGRVPLRNGPFTERWAYLVGEIAGQAAIDLLLGPVD